MKREYPHRPIVGVGAVILKGERVLLARRANSPGKGLWSLPGGAVECGETLTEALKREIEEEISAHIEIGGLVDVYDRIFRDEVGRVRYHYVLVDYWGRIAAGKPQAGSDISEIGWFAVKDLDSMQVGGQLKAAVKKATGLKNRRRRR
jgi:ADP-ribose pyrophosphatase YjhB (NUDIX family)